MSILFILLLFLVAAKSHAASPTPGSIIDGTIVDAVSGARIRSTALPYIYTSVRKWDAGVNDYIWVNTQNCLKARGFIQGCADETGYFAFDRQWNGDGIGEGTYLIRTESWWAGSNGTRYFVEDRFIKVDGVNPGHLGFVYLDSAPLAVLDLATVEVEQKDDKTLARWKTPLRNVGNKTITLRVVTEIYTDGPIGKTRIVLVLPELILLAPGQATMVDQNWVVPAGVLVDANLFGDVQFFLEPDQLGLLGETWFRTSLPQKPPILP